MKINYLQKKNAGARMCTHLLFCSLLLLCLLGIPMKVFPQVKYASKFGSPGSGPGQFNGPDDLAINSSGDVYVADALNNRIQVFDANGNFKFQFGALGSGPGQFNHPNALAIDAQDNVYVVDKNNYRIQKLNKSGVYLLQFGSFGLGNGQFSGANKIAIDYSTGNVYVTDYGNIGVHKFSSQGVFISKFGSSGSGPGQFTNPASIEIINGKIYVADQSLNNVQIFSLLGSYVAGFQTSGYVDGITKDNSGNFYLSIAGAYGDYLQKYSGNNVLLGQWGTPGTIDGEFSQITCIEYSPLNQRLYVSDFFNRIQLFDFIPSFNLSINASNYLNSSSYTFNSVAPVTFTIQNTGWGNLMLTGSPKVTISGPQSSAFQVVQALPGTVAANSQATFTIVCTPVVKGSNTATLQIQSNDPLQSPFTLNLSGIAIDINNWLSHSTITSKIGWQNVAYGDIYSVTDNELVLWQNWTASQKSDLQNSFTNIWKWFYSNQGGDLIPTIPVNMSPSSNLDNATASTLVSQNDGWNIYVNWLAQTLFLETYQIVPWSITSFDNESQFLLLSSSRMMSGYANTFLLGIGGNYQLAQLKRDTRGFSTISSPIYTYKFLIDNQIYVPGQDKITTIKKLLDWCRSLTHFYAQGTFKDTDDYWQYRGAPPIPKMVSGTTAPASPYFAHWTGGCHSTGGFLQNVLRAVNIPVELSIMAGHEVPIFRSENVFMSHGDDQYNIAFRDSKLTTASLLVPGNFFKDYYGVELASDLNNYDGSNTYLGFIPRPVSGYVGTDAGAMLAGAQLTFTNTQTSFQFPQTTSYITQADAHGYYTVAMWPGTYNVTVTRPGGTTIQTQITLNNWPQTVMFPSSLPCPPPTNLVVTGTSFTTASLSWTDSLATNNYEIDIQWSIGSKTSTNGTSQTTNSTNSVTVPVSEGVGYTATVRNYCGSVASLPSNTVYFQAGSGSPTSDARIANDQSKVKDERSSDQEKIAVAVYPNPVKDIIKLAGVREQSQILIIDTRGRELYNGVANGGIDVSSLPSGVYLLTIIGEPKKTFRFVKQ